MMLGLFLDQIWPWWLMGPGWNWSVPIHPSIQQNFSRISSSVLGICQYPSLRYQNQYWDGKKLNRCISSWKSEEAAGRKRGGEKIVKECTGNKNCPSPVMCILLMSVTYSTHMDISAVVKRWCDVHMTTGGFQLYFLLRIPVAVKIGKTLNS